MDQYTLKAIWKAMMKVVHDYELGDMLPGEYHELYTMILDYEDIEVTDMIDNMEKVYNLIDKSDYENYETEH